MNNELTHPVILFDGVCNLCCSSIQFIIKHDKQKRFRFASLQSRFAQKVLTKNPSLIIFDSIILLQNDNFYFRSTAILMIARQLNGVWKLFYGLIICPKFIRDAVYLFIANHRYKWFGKKNECMVPTKELNELFYE